MATIEHLFDEIRAMSPAEIEAKIAAHQAQIKVLKKVLLLVNETADEMETRSPVI